MNNNLHRVFNYSKSPDDMWFCGNFGICFVSERRIYIRDFLYFSLRNLLLSRVWSSEKLLSTK